jgi:hypothetical protein
LWDDQPLTISGKFKHLSALIIKDCVNGISEHHTDEFSELCQTPGGFALKAFLADNGIDDGDVFIQYFLHTCADFFVSDFLMDVIVVCDNDLF